MKLIILTMHSFIFDVYHLLFFACQSKKPDNRRSISKKMLFS